MIVGCYTVHLYCDAKRAEKCTSKIAADPARIHEQPEPAEFCAETGYECRTKARRAGWKLEGKIGRATCPACAKFLEVPALTKVQLEALRAVERGEDPWAVAKAAHKRRGARPGNLARVASLTVLSLRRRGLLELDYDAPHDFRLTDEGRAALAARSAPSG